MSISIIIIIGFLGFFALYFGGEILVTGTVNTAKKLKIPPHLIAVTVIAFGTSSPELFVSVNAVFKGSPDIAWGNVIGSNIANLLLVIGCASILAPLVSNSTSIKKDLFWMILSTTLFIIAAYSLNGINLIIGVIFIIILFLILLIMSSQIKKNNFVDMQENNPTIVLNYTVSPFIVTIIGILIILIGSELLVFSAKNISNLLSIEESIVGLTIVALGTSLPEVSASIIATKRGHTDIAIGNVIGSNIFNSLGILGAAGIASSPNILLIPKNFLYFDIPILFLVTLLVCFNIIWLKRISRTLGIFYILFYLIYLFIIFK